MLKAGSIVNAAVRAASVVLVVLSNAIAAGGWKVYWSDEFDSTALNESNWSVQATDNPPNAEQEHYTSGHDQSGSNVFVKNGHLILEARSASEITSGKIVSSGKKTFEYGRMEARMRLPLTQGMWPAFWMLGVGGGWPQCGELDIMEGKGRLPNWTSGSFHYTNFDVFNQYTLPTGNVHDSFHVYAAEWSTDSIRWYFDNVNFGTLTKAQNANLPLDKQYYFILNLAVGGNFDGNMNNTTVFPDSLIVDYVRVYQWDPTAQTESPVSGANLTRASLVDRGGDLSIVLPSDQAYILNLVSTSGKLVLSQRGSARSFTVGTGALSPGVYCVTVRGTFGTLSGRVAVHRRS
jgi:beta-glucanase (GH16 family)